MDPVQKHGESTEVLRVLKSSESQQRTEPQE